MGLQTGFSIRVKLPDETIKLVILPRFLGQKGPLFIPGSGGAVFFAGDIKGLGMLAPRAEVFDGGALQFSGLPGGGVAGSAVWPPALGGSFQLVPKVVQVVRDRAVRMKKGGRTLASTVHQSVKGALPAVRAEENLRSGHFAGLHAGFRAQFSVRGVELPVAFRQTTADGTFGRPVSFFIQIDPPAIPAIEEDNLAPGNGTVRPVKDQLHLSFRSLAGTQDHGTGDVPIGPAAEDFQGDQGGFLIVPNGIARGLAGGIGKLGGVLRGPADGLGGLQSLEDDVENQSHLALRSAPERNQGQSQNQNRAGAHRRSD